MASSAPMSWQSALGGLVVLAVNSMCQPAGKVCDAPRATGLWMRISPIICFLDMSGIIYRTVFYSIRRGSLGEACTLVMTQRYANDDESARSALADFRRNAPLRWISFLASLSQIVKLLAVQGLIWTKVWASMYLASFLVIELFVIYAKRRLPREWPDRSHETEPNAIQRTKGARSFPYTSIAASVIFACCFAITAVASVFKHYGQNFGTLKCTGLVLLVSSVLVFVPSSYYSYITRVDRNRVYIAFILLFMVLAVPGIYLLVTILHDADRLRAQISTFVVPALVLLWALLCLAWASQTFAHADTGPPGSLRRLEIILAMCFTTINVIAAVLYYCFSYNPQGTTKPAWTEKLG